MKVKYQRSGPVQFIVIQSLSPYWTSPKETLRLSVTNRGKQ